MLGRLLTFIACLLFAPLALAAEPAASDLIGDVSSVVACDTAEQVDSIIAAWQISQDAGHDTFGGLSQPGTGLYGDEPACIIAEISEVSLVAVTARGQIVVEGIPHAVWMVQVHRDYEGSAGMDFYLLWSDATSIRYGPDA